MKIEIRTAGPEDVASLYNIYEKIGARDEGYFEGCLEEGRTILIVSADQNDVGFGMLNREPKYSLYRKLGMPEIQDVNVLPDFRGKGLATAIIETFEKMAQEEGATQIGISVGITKEFGPAQRLYHKLGYVPDGFGVTHDRLYIETGRLYPPEDLCLMMVKDL